MIFYRNGTYYKEKKFQNKEYQLKEIFLKTKTLWMLEIATPLK